MVDSSMDLLSLLGALVVMVNGTTFHLPVLFATSNGIVSIVGFHERHEMYPEP